MTYFTLLLGASCSDWRELLTGSHLNPPMLCCRGSWSPWWRDRGGVMRWTPPIHWGHTHILHALPKITRTQLRGSLSRTRPVPCPKRPSPPATTPWGSYSPMGRSVLSRPTLQTRHDKTKNLILGWLKEKWGGVQVFTFVFKAHFMFDCMTEVGACRYLVMHLWTAGHREVRLTLEVSKRLREVKQIFYSVWEKRLSFINKIWIQFFRFSFCGTMTVCYVLTINLVTSQRLVQILCLNSRWRISLATYKQNHEASLVQRPAVLEPLLSVKF